MKVVAVIPARLASTRFPGKPLAKIHGRSVIEHVYRRVQCATLIDEVYLATCDKEIANEVERFKGNVIMTSSLHTRGTDRVAEAVEKIEADFVINVQGDEPMVDPGVLDEAITFIQKRGDIRCLQLTAQIRDWKVFISQNVVKATTDMNNKILYLSRQPIPAQTKHDFKKALKQIGIYLIHKDLLLQFSRWDETPLEKTEKVDMLRILENGVPIYAFNSRDMISVDTPEELFLVEQILSKDPLYHQLFTTDCKSG